MRSLPSILLVEDNPDDETLALDAMRRAGITHPVIVARDGIEALARLLPNGAPATMPLPALVLLDLKLPRLSGLDVLRRLRAHPRTRGLPVVVLSTSREWHDINACYECGANSYVCKPVAYGEFVALMQQVAHYWLRLNVLQYS